MNFRNQQATTVRLPAGTVTMSLLVFAALGASCGTSTSGNDTSTPPPDGEIAQSDLELANNVRLTANVRRWNDQNIIVDYTLVNSSDTDVMMLDVSHSLQIEQLDDGRVRLFKGMQETGDTDFAQPPTIEGRALSAGSSATGSGTRRLPLQVDYGGVSIIDPATDTLEFCIAYGRASKLAPAMVDEGLYSLNSHVDLQNLACATIERSEPGETGLQTAPFDDERWEDTLGRVIEMLDGKDPLIAVDAVNLLVLPDESTALDGPVQITDNISFSTEGGGGNVVIATCENGGGFEITTSSADYGREHIDATDCTIGAWTVHGRLQRIVSSDQSQPDSTNIEFDNLIVTNDTTHITMSSGRYAFQDSHPIATSELHELSYMLESDGESSRVNNMEIEDVSIFGAAFDRTLTTSFTVTAPWTNDAPLKASTTIALSGLTTSETGRDFTRGSLELVTDDASRLTLDIDNNVAGEVLITLERGGSVTTVYRPNPLPSS